MIFQARSFWAAVAVCVGAAISAKAQVVPQGSPVRDRWYSHPDLYVAEATETLQQVGADQASRLRALLPAFGVSEGSIFFDSRTGRVTSLILSQPLIPGRGVGNHLAWGAPGAPSSDTVLQAEVWSALRGYVQSHQHDLGIDLAELATTPRIGIYDRGTLIFVHVPRVVDGIPVRDNAIGAAIKHGNLLLLGLPKWGDVRVSRTPAVSAGAARDTVAAHVAPFAISGELADPHLELIPMSSGGAIGYRLAWVVLVRVGDDIGRWEGLVDAANGTLLAFEDRNQYADGQITGGVYPLSNDQRPPDGVEQESWPMPFVDYTVDGVKQYTDVGGNLGCIPGSISTALNGLFIKMSDTCGAANETGTSGIELGSGPTPAATDCVVPPGHSAGDTKSSRSGYYELNRIAEQARGYLPASDPGGAWARQQLTANMNIPAACNATWNGSAVNFYRSAFGQGCANTGEIAAVFDHEWGHGMDDNGVNPSIAGPGEAIADIYAMMRLNTSCIGRGFHTDGPCGGYGDACDGTLQTGCTGVRDIDYDKHRCDAPHTISWILNGFTDVQCAGPGGAAACPATGSRGPCNRETHCEGMVAAEALFDLKTRDLTAPPFSYDAQRAHELTARLAFLGAQPISAWYTCSVGGGCSATGGYLNLLAVDDDNGNLADGTPHMTAIRAAFERHEIHCPTPAPQDSGCAGAPSEAPVVTLTGQDRAIEISWTEVADASSYLVYRGDGIDGCNYGKAIIANTSDLSFVDTGLANGRTYSYSVVPVGSNEACFGPMSDCAQGEPVAGPNLAFTGRPSFSGGDGDPFLDNCETATVVFSVNNIGVEDLTNVRIVSITPVTHPQSMILTALPAPIAASMATCTVAQGSFEVIPEGLTFNGQTEFLVEVAADELGAETRSQMITFSQTESDLAATATQTFGFESGREGWITTSGTFNRILGSGADGTSAHMSSSTNMADACDVVQSPIIVLTDASTLSMWVRYDIEPTTDAPYDRANVSVVNAGTGERTVVSPSSGRTYNVANGSPNGTCETGGQAGWNGTTTGFPANWFQADWNAGAFNAGGAFTDLPAHLQINYGTDELDSRTGFDFDQVTITDFYLQVPDAHSNDCSMATQVGPAGLVVDGAGNGVLEVGEVAVISPSWENTGLNAVALNGTASVFDGPAGPAYDLVDAAGAYDVLNPSDAGACTDCYGVSITAATRPVVHWDATITEDVSPAALAEGSLAQKIWTLHVGESFTDVPSSSPFYPSVENVLHNGVTAGCGAGTTFCPTDTVTRQQMAVFLLKAAEGAGYTPPACVTEVFADVPCASPFASWINELAARGVTAGCGNGTVYCPGDPTTRQQMAVFLLKTAEGSTYVPPACTTEDFADVPCSSPFAPWIYELVARNVTAGCGGGNYCPANQVARQQMAVFLVKTFGLSLYGL